VLMRGMQGGCQHVGGTDNVVHRSKRIETLAPLLIIRERQRDDRSGSYLVLNGLEEMETAGKNGTAKIEARRGRSQTLHVPTAKAEFRQRIVQLTGPFVAGAASLDRNDIGREPSIFGEKRALQHVHGLHAVNRYGGAKLARGRIRGI